MSMYFFNRLHLGNITAPINSPLWAIWAKSSRYPNLQEGSIFDPISHWDLWSPEKRLDKDGIDQSFHGMPCSAPAQTQLDASLSMTGSEANRARRWEWGIERHVAASSFFYTASLSLMWGPAGRPFSHLPCLHSDYLGPQLLTEIQRQ